MFSVKKCCICNRPIDEFKEGHIIENGKVYCEKCYANKQWSRLKSQNKHHKWLLSNYAIIRSIERISDKEARKQAIKEWIRKIPDEHLALFTNHKEVEKCIKEVLNEFEGLKIDVSKLDIKLKEALINDMLSFIEKGGV